MINRKKTWRSRALTISLAAIMSFPIAANISIDNASAAVKKYPVISQPFKIKGESSRIGTINKSGSTYIALRDLNTALGLKTKYVPSTQHVQVTGRERTMEMGLQNSSYVLNGQPVLGPEVIVQSGTTYLPLRFLSESFGYEVTYENKSKTIGLKAISENALSITAESIGADGEDKSLLVFYPVLSGYKDAEVQQKINKFLKKEADRFVSAGSKQMDPVVKENNAQLAKDPKASIRRPSFDGRFTVTHNEKGLLSLYADYSVYLGGAHSDTAREAYTFDLSTGDLLTLKEAVGGGSDYVTIINQQIKKQIADRKLTLIAPFKTIEPDRDFFLSHDGVVIYFTQYEYTSFAEGMPKFVIPYSAFTKR
ncbi:stalk domain-containing protein [Paenibacillus polygoni]|uniref:Stalk domain-containing protein n=1 Tax=Paenibacillus polygoni TaxID=3050112 RepID=A0ABY8X731_9BACL|nr:stalk domain-containing protein [Paenibacillus polygoni]WIV18970.1 stalk domain-containing protein [Paenibacillus polygoni]